MKIPFLISAFLLIGLTSFSQDCKFSYNKVDPISGEKEQRINFRANGYFTMAFYHKGDDYRIESYIWMPGVQVFNVPVGSKLEVKLANGKLLTLENATEALPVADVSGDVVLSTYAMSYKITKEQYAEISANGIGFMRTHLKEANYYDYEFKKKEIEKSKASAGCILGK